MKQLVNKVLACLLLVPLVGSSRLALTLLRFLARRPQVALLLTGLYVAFSIGNPIVDQLSVEGVWLIEHTILLGGGVTLAVLILAFGVSSREVRRVWRRVR